MRTHVGIIHRSADYAHTRGHSGVEDFRGLERDHCGDGKFNLLIHFLQSQDSKSWGCCYSCVEVLVTSSSAHGCWQCPYQYADSQEFFKSPMVRYFRPLTLQCPLSS